MVKMGCNLKLGKCELELFLNLCTKSEIAAPLLHCAGEGCPKLLPRPKLPQYTLIVNFVHLTLQSIVNLRGFRFVVNSLHRQGSNGAIEQHLRTISVAIEIVVEIIEMQCRDY